MNKVVLVLDCGATQIIAIAESLYKKHCDIIVLSCSKDSYGYNSNFVKERYLCPQETSSEYSNFVLDFLRSHRIDVVIPTSDLNAKFCSLYKEEICRYSNVLIPPYEIFIKGYNKNTLMKICKNKGFPHPISLDLEPWDGEITNDIEYFPYPGLIKPNITSGGRGISIVNNAQELRDLYPRIKQEYGECHLQQFIKKGGKQIKVQIMTDLNGALAYSSVIWKQRYYPVNGGSSCCNVSIEDPGVVSICANVLKEIGWIGFADFDLIENPDNHELLIMEINPRTPACIRVAYKSGMDYAAMIVEESLGQPLGNYKYTPGISLRHIGLDMLWFLKSPDRFQSNPSWFKYDRRNTYFQDCIKGDLKAFIRGTWGNFKKQMNPEFRKAKDGIKMVL